jgi:hypothetical protein
MLKFSICARSAAMSLGFLFGSFPVDAAQVLFYVDGVAAGLPTRAGDLVVRDRLVGLGHTVTTVLDSAGTIADTVGKNLIIISSSIQSGDMAAYASASLRTLALPLIDYESALYDELFLGASGTNPVSLTSLTIALPAHPLAAGLTGTPTVYGTAGTMSAGVPGTLGPDATVVATLPSGEPAIFAYLAGNRLSDSATLATARRIGFYFNETGVPGANADGLKLFDAAVGYALIPEPGCVSLLAAGYLGLALRRRRQRTPPSLAVPVLTGPSPGR